MGFVVGGAGCSRTAAAGGQAASGRALAHVHEFPSSGARLAPPTGMPKLSWRQAVLTPTVAGFFGTGPPPEVRLADYTNRFRGPARPTLVWVAVGPDRVVVDMGPEAARDPGRCPLYVVVDASSGQGYGAWQHCDPPYRG